MSKASGPIQFISSGNLILKDCEPADGLRPAAVDGGVVLSAKKKQCGITYMATATEATVKNARAMSGAWVSMSKPLGEYVCGEREREGRGVAEVWKGRVFDRPRRGSAKTRAATGRCACVAPGPPTSPPGSPQPPSA